MTKKKEFAFPPEEEIEKVIKRFSDPNYRRVNQGLRPNASMEEKKKYELCQNISRNTQENNLAEKELGQKLGIDQIKVEYILFGHYKKLTLKELTNYSNILQVNSLTFSELREKNILLILKSYHNKHKWL